MGEGLPSSCRAASWGEGSTRPVSRSLRGALSTMSCVVGVSAPGVEVSLGVRGLISNSFLLPEPSRGGVAHPEPRLATAPAGVEGGAGLRGGACLIGLARAALGTGADAAGPGPVRVGGIV